MIQRLCSLRKIPGLKKLSTRGIEGGYTRMTRGEGVETFSMVKMSSGDLHVRGAVKKYMSC